MAANGDEELCGAQERVSDSTVKSKIWTEVRGKWPLLKEKRNFQRRPHLSMMLVSSNRPTAERGEFDSHTGIQTPSSISDLRAWGQGAEGQLPSIVNNWRLMMSNIVTGRQLRSARILAGLTQKQLAQAVGVCERAARYWELKNDRAPTSTLSTLEKIEASFNRTVDRNPDSNAYRRRG
jgi:DNA-binding XRE family transcriptional regulator